MTTIQLVRLYLLLKRHGWKGVIWCDDSRFYVANDFVLPDYRDKHFVTETELERILTDVQSNLRKPPSSLNVTRTNRHERIA